jgi:hypothetical protein
MLSFVGHAGGGQHAPHEEMSQASALGNVFFEGVSEARLVIPFLNFFLYEVKSDRNDKKVTNSCGSCNSYGGICQAVTSNF